MVGPSVCVSADEVLAATVMTGLSLGGGPPEVPVSETLSTYQPVLALLASGQLDVRPVLGGVWALENWHEAFEKMHSGEIVKAVLKPV